MAIIELSESNFNKIISDNDIVILDFWAPWCGPCLQFAPTFEETSNKVDGVAFAKVNTENEQALGAHFGIRSIPTLMIFREGISIFSQAGALSGRDLEDLLEKAKKLDMNKIRKEIEASSSQ